MLFLNAADVLPDNPSVIIREGLYDTPPDIGHVCMVEMWNFSTQDAILPAGTQVAQITKGPSFALRHDDANLEEHQ